jgi:NAD-dependent dihydropyrimidine dehydrogenase PreA subunit
MKLTYLKNVATLRLTEDKCTGCGTCLLVCPHEVFAKFNGRVRIDDPDQCMECGACALNCPEEALSVDAGVGCATAVINTTLGWNSGDCCCVIEPPGSEAAGKTSGFSASSCC